MPTAVASALDRRKQGRSFRRKAFLAASTALGVALASGAEAAVVRVSEAAFVAGSGLITFSEPGFAEGTVNPTYIPADYGGGAASPTVTFRGFFSGQSAGSTNPSACPSGAAISGCVLGSPTGPLALDPDSPDTFITADGANPTSPVLSGTPTFDGSIAILFSTPQIGVGLDGGFFDDVGSTAITAFDSAGNVIGSIFNIGTGIEFLGLVETTGTGRIAGLLFSLVGNESAGFAIDNLRFGRAGEVVPPPVPTPAAAALFGAGLLGLLAVGRRRRPTDA